MDDLTLGWLAGILEGEGCFPIEARRYARIAVQMTDEDIIRRLHTVTGVGHVNGPYWPSGRHHKASWRWIVHKAADVEPLLRAIYPLMGQRRQAKIEDCLQFTARPTGRPRQTECDKGHPMIGDNLYVAPSGHRRCQACAVITTGYRLSRLPVS